MMLWLPLSAAGLVGLSLSLPARPPCSLRAAGCALVVEAELEPPLDSDARLGLAQHADLGPAVDVLMDGFYKDALTLAAEEFSEAEMEAMRPVLSRVNGQLRRFTRTMLFLQANGRCGERLRSPSLEPPPSGGSLMICVHKPATGEIVGVVEVSIEPKDGRVPGEHPLSHARIPNEHDTSDAGALATAH